MEGVGVGGSAVSSNYVDSGTIRGAGGLCDSDSSTRVLRRSGDNRNVSGAVWQLHIVGVEVGIEAIDIVAIHLNIREASVVGSCGNELDLIGSAATINGIGLNNHRVAIDSALLHNLKLLAGEFATRESGLVAAGIGERTCTAYTEDGRNLSGFAH